MFNNVNSWEILYRKGPTEDRNEPRAIVVKVLERLKKMGVTRLLDLGCGDGRHLHYLASSGFEPVGADYAPTALRLARAWLDETGLYAAVVNADMSTLPFRNAYFDAVLCTQVLNHGLIADIRQAIGEIERVLAPGGWLFLTVSIWDASALPEKDFIQTEPNTYLPLVGDEKGVPHYLFNPESLTREFSAFELPEGIIWVREHILGLLARKPVYEKHIELS